MNSETHSDTAQLVNQTPAPGAELTRLDLLVGEWEVEGETRESLAAQPGR